MIGASNMEEKYLEIITQTVERAKSNTHQIEEIKMDIKEIKEENKALNKMATSIELIAKDMTNMKEDISEMKTSQTEMKAEISEVKSEGMKRKAGMFDNIWMGIAKTVGVGILAFVLGALFPTIFK